ncbi:MAG: tetratricopeptide repeat protein [Phycisphaerae bacterium]
MKRPLVLILVVALFVALAAVAAVAMRAAADLQRENPALALAASQLLLRQGDVSLARDYLNRALALKPKDPALIRRAAALLSQLGEYQQALNLLHELPAEGGVQTPTLALAVLYRQDGMLDESEAVCRKLLEKPDPTTIQFTADLLAFRGKIDQAQKVLDLMDNLPLRPGFKELVRGEFERNYGKPETALAFFRTATKLAPTEVPAWRQLAYTYLMLDQPKESAAVLRQAAAALPGNPQFQILAQQADLLQDLATQVPTQGLVAALFQAPAEQLQPILEILQLLQKARADGDTFNVIMPKLRQQVERNPRVLPLLVLLTQFDLAIGQLDDAIAVSTRGMQSFPTSAEPARLATLALGAAGRWDEMLGAAQEWRRRSLPERLQADLAIAKAQFQRGHPDESLKQLQPYLAQAHAQPDNAVSVILAEMEALLAQKLYDQAAAILEPQLPRSASWREVWRNAAISQIRDTKTSSAWLEKLGAATPAEALDEQVAIASSWRALGAARGVPAYQATGRKMIEDLAAKPGAGAAVYVALGMLRQEQGDLTAAEAAYRKCLALDPHQFIAQNNLASLLVLRPGADLTEAKALMADAIKTKPRVASYYDTQAEVLVKLKQIDEAVASLNQAVRLEPGNLDWQFNLATILLDAGRRDKAGAVLEQIESLHLSPPRLTPA